MQRSVASFGLRMWRRCASASALSYKKVTRGSEFLPGYAMQAPGLVDLKRRRRLAARVLLSDARGGPVKPRATIDPGAFRVRTRERSPPPEQERKNPDNESLPSNVIVAEPVSAHPEPESCCARLLWALPRAFSCRFDASFE